MAMNGELLQPLLVLGVLILLILVASAASEPNSGCDHRCGSVEIPYPFGTSEGCCLDSTFLITCNNTFQPPKPSLAPDVFVEKISVLDGELRVSNPVASLCKKRSCALKGIYSRCSETGNVSVDYSGNSALFKLSNFRISDKGNKIIAVGCGVYSFIQGFVEQKGFTTGCLSLCNNNASDVVNGSCFGIGCCQTFIGENRPLRRGFWAEPPPTDERENGGRTDRNRSTGRRTTGRIDYGGSLAVYGRFSVSFPRRRSSERVERERAAEERERVINAETERRKEEDDGTDGLYLNGAVWFKYQTAPF